MSATLENTATELEEIKDEMLELIERAARVMNRCPDRTINSRAQAYWVAHIRMAIDAGHEYLGNAGHSIADTIAALRAEAGE